MDALLHNKYSRFCPFPQVVIVKNSPAICKFFGTSYITSFSLMNCSNSFRLTSFFVPTNKTKGQLGERSILSILLMPMLLYSAASLAVSVILRWMGTVRMLSMEMSPFVVLNQRTFFRFCPKNFLGRRSEVCAFAPKGPFTIQRTE